MKVLRVEGEGLVTSFRYPHFMQGVQPTFEMPPPATIYGHVCSALGDWFDPAGVLFALRFTFDARFDDIEHTHVLGASTGKLKGTSIPKVLEGAVNPFRRGLLFRPRLTLYLNKPDWEGRFRNPHYPVVLGRSQDLFTYTGVSVVDLEPADHGYFSHTLLPYDFLSRTASGTAVLMPRFVDYSDRRRPAFQRYLVLNRRLHSRDLLQLTEERHSYLIDPGSEEITGDHLALVFHSWVGDSGGPGNVA